MLTKIAAGAVIAIAAILGFAATRPGTFRVQRTVSIQAPPEKIYPLVSDFHQWASWSPYEKLDPGMKKTYSGPARGAGAVYEWAGNDKAGAGRMEIVDAAAPSAVKIKIDFFKPFEGHNLVDFTMRPQGGATSVTWAMHGPQTFVTKVMTIFVSMDKMLGKEFESGLNNIKAIAENRT